MMIVSVTQIFTIWNRKRMSIKENFVNWITKICIILVTFHLEPTTASYKVAVFDHHSPQPGLPKDMILKNVEIFAKQIEKAVDRGVDLIVFPEYGLTPVNADPATYATDVSTSNEIIKTFQNLSAEYSIYIVLNVLEKSTDISNTTKYYNTNLVFDANGNIIAKYRKINLSPEEKANKLTPGNETVTFETEFGVKFGLFNFFDIFFHKPAKEVLASEKVTEVVVPTAWKSYAPFQMSSSILYGYSVANNVGVVAAGYKIPSHEYVGGGIFTVANDTKTYHVRQSPNSMLMIKDIPRRGMRKSLDQPGRNQHGYAIDKKTAYTIHHRKFQGKKFFFKSVDFSRKKILEEICHGHFCCRFNITINESNINEIFKLVIYDGLDELGGDNTHLRFCSLLACENDTNDSCGTQFSSTVTFTQIKISTSSKKTDAVFYIPNTLTHDLQPIQNIVYSETNTENVVTHTVTTSASQSNVLAFGLLSRIGEENEETEDSTTPENTLKSTGSTERVSSAGNAIPNVILLLLVSFSSVCICTRIWELCIF